MISTMAKKHFFVLIFLTLCSFSFTQNIRVIGNIPKADTEKLYQLQIGAYRLAVNVKAASETLTKNNFVPHYEKKDCLVRVFVVVNTNQVRSSVDRLGKAGFREVVIREYAAGQVEDKAEEIIEYAETWDAEPVCEIPEPDHDLIHLYTE